VRAELELIQAIIAYQDVRPAGTIDCFHFIGRMIPFALFAIGVMIVAAALAHMNGVAMLVLHFMQIRLAEILTAAAAQLLAALLAVLTVHPTAKLSATLDAKSIGSNF